MPKLTPERITDLIDSNLKTLLGLDELLTNDDGITLLNLFIDDLQKKITPKGHERALVVSHLKNLLVNELTGASRFNPYIFNRNRTTEIKVPTKTRIQGRGKTAKEFPKEFADGFLGPLDFTLIKASSDAHTYTEFKPYADISNLLLTAPIEAHPAYFNRLIATLLMQVKGINDQKRRLQIIGSFCSLLVGLDVLKILRDKFDTYHVHIEEFLTAVSAEEASLTGFLPWLFLPLRILLTMQIYVELHLGFINEDKLLEDTKEFCDKWEFKDTLKIQDFILERLLFELKRTLQTYWISRLGYYISEFPKDDSVARAALISSMTQGVVASIKKLPNHESLIMYLAWEGVKDAESHALYLQVHRVGGSWNLLIHNLGSKSDLHTHTPAEHDKKTLYYPYGLGSVTEKAWAIDGAGFKYIQSILKALYPLSKQPIAYPIFYDLKTNDKKLVGSDVVPLDVKAYQALTAQEVGNCVYANHESSRSLYLPIKWLRKEESVRTSKEACSEVPDFDEKLLALLNSSPQDEIPRPKQSHERKKELIGNAGAALKDSYRLRYEMVAPFSALWKDTEVPMRMKDCYLELQLVERTGLENEEKDKDFTFPSIGLNELLKRGGQQRLVGQFGSGKSTLLQNIAYRWACNEIGTEYEIVILFPLRKLKSVRISGDTPEKKVSSCLGQICFDEEFDAESRDNLASKIFSADGISDKRVLWLLDGYDEVASGLNDEQRSVMEFIKGQSHVYISTRPVALSPEDAARPHILIKGLNDTEIERWLYIHTHRPEINPDELAKAESRSAALLAHLKNNPHIWHLVHYPIYLKMVCMAFLCDDKERSIDLRTSTQIFSALCDMIADIHYGKADNTGAYDSAKKYWQPLEDTLALIAFQIMDLNDGYEVQEDRLIAALIGLIKHDYKRNWVNDLIHSGLLKPTTSVSEGKIPSLEFIHPSFREYFAAKHIIKFMLSKPEKFTVWFKKNKFQPRYQEAVWRFVSGLLPSKELANAWFLLWLGTPTKIGVRESDLKFFEHVAELITESPSYAELPLRKDLFAFINKNWGSNITCLPASLARLIDATRLWADGDATSWIDKIKDLIHSWNEKIYIDPINLDTATQFYEAINNCVSLLRDSYRVKSENIKFLWDLLSSEDLALRGCSNSKEISTILDKLDDGIKIKQNAIEASERHRYKKPLVKTALEDIKSKKKIIETQEYLSHRMRFLTAIILIKMQIHEPLVIEQLEDALLWCANNSKSAEILRLIIGAIDETRLSNDRINKRLFECLRTFKTTSPDISKTLILMISVLSVQISKDPSILTELSLLLNNDNIVKAPIIIKHILQVLTKHHYASGFYLNTLFKLLTNDSIVADVVEVLQNLAISNPDYKGRIDTHLAEVSIKAPEFKSSAASGLSKSDSFVVKKPTESEISKLLTQASALEIDTSNAYKLLMSEDSKKSKSKKDLEQSYCQNRMRFNEMVRALITALNPKSSAYESLLTFLLGKQLFEIHALDIINNTRDTIFIRIALYQKLPLHYLEALVDYVIFDAIDHCCIYFTDGKSIEFTTEPEVNFWKGLCDKNSISVFDFFEGMRESFSDCVLALPSGSLVSSMLADFSSSYMPSALPSMPQPLASTPVSYAASSMPASLSFLNRFESALRNQFRLTIEKVMRDGNCQFRAIAKQLFWKNPHLYAEILRKDEGMENELAMAQELRTRAVAHMRAHIDDYRGFNINERGVRGVVLLQDQVYASIEDYLSDIENDKTFVSDYTLNALAQMLGMNILLLTETALSDPRYLDHSYYRSGADDRFSPNNTLIITYNGVDHYETVSNDANPHLVSFVQLNLPADVAGLLSTVSVGASESKDGGEVDIKMIDLTKTGEMSPIHPVSDDGIIPPRSPKRAKTMTFHDYGTKIIHGPGATPWPEN